MSATVTEQVDQGGDVPTTRPRAVPPSSTRFDRVMLAEWTKIRTLRSTGWTLASLFVVTVGFSGLVSWATIVTLPTAPEEAGPGPGDILTVVLSGLTLSQLAIAVLGALVITGEYSTGGIRSTLTAVPGRLRLLAAKAVVFFLVALAVGLVTVLVAFYVAQLILATKGLNIGIGDPQVLRCLLGGGLYLAGSGMFGFGIGALVRHSAGAITAAVGVLLVMPLLVLIIPGSIGDTIAKYFTANAGNLITQFDQGGALVGMLSPWQGYAVFTVEWAVVLVIAAVLMRRRDA
jgi:ABC-2 type transport system permease protein